MRLIWWLVLVGGCYAPSITPGAPCSVDQRCPQGLACQQGSCVVPGTGGRPDATVSDASSTDASSDAAIPMTPVAHWKFDDDPTDGADDSSGRGHTASCTACPELVAGKQGGGYRFDRAMAQLLRVPDDADFRGPFTISAWINPTDSTNQLAILSKPVGSSSGNSWQLELLSNDHISFSGGSPHALEGAVTIPPASWHHVAGTWDGTTKRLFIDGVPVASVASAITYDSHPLFLGGDENGGTAALHFDGVLDELRVYRVVLSDLEIAALAQ